MKLIILAMCLSLSSGICAAQNREAIAQGTVGKVTDEKLILCVKNGDANCVTLALAMGADANTVDEKGMTVLILAAEGKSASVVRFLLGAGADVNKARQGEGTPLCRAALFGRKEIAETLLERGAKINIVCDSDHGDTPLMDALRGAMYGDMPGDLKEELVETNGNDGGSENDNANATDEARNEAEKLREVLNAPRDDFLAIARLLLARGADVNVVAKCDVGETALMYAATGASVEMVKELLARGADVNEGASVLTLLLQFEREYERVKRLVLPALSKEQTAMLAWSEKTRGGAKK